MVVVVVTFVLVVVVIVWRRSSTSFPTTIRGMVGLDDVLVGVGGCKNSRVRK